MKKIFIYSTLIAAAFSFAACNEDYKNWADPQTNAQEDQLKTAAGTFSVVEHTVSLKNYTDNIPLVAFTKDASVAEGSTVKYTKLTMAGFELPASTINDTLMVQKQDIYQLVKEAYGTLAEDVYMMDFNVEASLVDPAGTAVLMPVGATIEDISVITEKLPSIAYESAYYYIGNYNGWNLASPTPMEANGDGSYSCIIEIGDSEWFAFAPQSAVDAQNWDGLFRAQANGDESTSGFFGESASGHSFCCQKGGKYKFTINPTDWTYSYAPYSESLYYAGDANGWTFSPLVKSGNDFVGYYYVKYADNSSTWGFKFCTDPSWDNPQYGAGDTAGSIALGGGNIQLAPKDAFYKIIVNTDAATCELQEVTSITCVGNHNGWNVSDASQHMTYNVDAKCWELTTELTNGFKFAINDDWAISWGGANGDPKMYDVLTEYSGKDLDAPEGDGTYFIQLYLGCEGTHKVVLTKK